jgi:hypothetical protein
MVTRKSSVEKNEVEFMSLGAEDLNLVHNNGKKEFGGAQKTSCVI